MDIEKGVLDLQWVEGPLHVLNAAGESLTPLLPLELRAKAAIAVGGADRQHVGVEVGARPFWAFLNPRQRDGETDQGISGIAAQDPEEFAVKGADHLAADFLCEQEGFARDDIALVVAPGFDLELDAGRHLGESLARANLDHGFAGDAGLALESRAFVSSVASVFLA